MREVKVGIWNKHIQAGHDFGTAWSSLSNHEVIWPYLPKILLIFAFLGVACYRLNRERGQKEKKAVTFAAYYEMNLGNLVCGMRSPSIEKIEYLSRGWDTNFRR